MNDLIEKIKATKSRAELDALRLECVQAMNEGEEAFHLIQNAFIKQKNKLKRNGL